MTEEEIAISFSMGRFEEVYDYISSSAVWEIIESSTFIGRDEIITNCKNVATYFKSVETNFIMLSLECIGNKIAISGSAEFKRNNQLLSNVDAYDVYEFNEEKKLEKIYSYCIINK